MYPAFAEEWVDLVVGALFGLNNGFLFDQKRCQRFMFSFTGDLADLYMSFDMAFPTTALPIIMRVFAYTVVAVKLYTATMVCMQETMYQHVFRAYMGDEIEDSEDHEMTDMAEGESLLTKLRQSEDETAVEDGDAAHHEEDDSKLYDWEKDHSDHDPAYIDPDFSEYMWFTMQCLALAVNSYGLYSNMASSYYWFKFGKNVTTVFTATSHIIQIAFDWQGYVYMRHIIKMLMDRMSGIVPSDDEENTEADFETVDE